MFNFDSQDYYDPHKVTFDNINHYKLLKENGDCVWDDKNNLWIISGYNNVKNGLKDYKRYTANYGTTLETRRTDLYEKLPFHELDPPENIEIRRLINQVISAKVDNDFKLKLKNNFKDELIPCLNKEIDVVNNLFLIFPMMVIFDLLGVEKKNIDFIKSQSKKFFDMSCEKDKQNARLEIADFVYNNPPDLVMQIFNNESTSKKFTKKSISYICVAILAAGFETVAAELTNLIYNCNRYTSEYYKVLRNPKLVPFFVEESLRYRYLSQFIIRTSTCDHNFNGNKIKSGDTVMFVTGSAGFDSDYLQDRPGNFIIDRDISKHNFAFGYGPHVCPGQKIARSEMIAVLESIIEISPKFKITSGSLKARADLSGMMWDSMNVEFLGQATA